MIKLFYTFAGLLIFSVFPVIYAVETPRTAMIGGVELFDTESPMVGMQNPALLYEYGRIDPVGTMLTNSETNIITNILDFSASITNKISYTNKSRKIRVTNAIVLSNYQVTNVISTNMVTIKEAPARYHFGRVFLLNPYFSAGATGDMLNSFKYYANMLQGQMAGTPEDQANALRTAFLIASLGMIDLQPMFSSNKASTYDIVSNLIQASQSRSGVHVGVNLNLLSYTRDRVGVAFLIESEAYGGTVSENRNLFFMINDPIFSMQVRAGMAVSVSPGSFDLPLIGNTAVGFTVRVYPEILEAKVESAIDYFELYNQFYAFSTNGASATAFGDGRLVKMGFGLSGDIAILKNINSDFQITFKLNDIISPRYWLNSQQFGWVLPDLSFGMRYIFPIGGVLKYFVNKPSLYFQMDDLFYTQTKSLLAKLKLGADTFLLLDLFQLGIGLNAGYPTLGLSFHLPLFFIHYKIYASVYGKEMGKVPGDFGFQGYTVGTEFYLGF